MTLELCGIATKSLDWTKITGVQWLFLLEYHHFFILQWEVQTIIKLKLKQASKEI